MSSESCHLDSVTCRRHRESVFDRNGVQGTVVHAASPGAIFLLDEKNGGRKRVVAGLYEVSLKHGRNLSHNLRFLEMGVPIGSNVDWGGLW